MYWFRDFLIVSFGLFGEMFFWEIRKVYNIRFGNVSLLFDFV